MAADVPKIVLVPHERSHHFVKRECVVSEALKVGRSVDRRRISQNNLIFDCRVLSRNHALILFENGKVTIILPAMLGVKLRIDAIEQLKLQYRPRVIPPLTEVTG